MPKITTPREATIALAKALLAAAEGSEEAGGIGTRIELEMDDLGREILTREELRLLRNAWANLHVSMKGGFEMLAESFEEAEYQREQDKEACPGCGAMPGDGYTPGCHHANGCGYGREMELAGKDLK